MARTYGPKCRQCRREGVKLFLKGPKCDTSKCPLTRKPTPPGESKSYPRRSAYSDQLREKQKVKRVYGLLEKQFRRFYEMARKNPAQTGIKLLQLLELRLDNVVFRLGFAPSRNEARQLVTHGHVTVNGKKLSIPSHLISVNDEIALIAKISGSDKNKEFRATNKNYKAPVWLGVREDGTGLVIKEPDRTSIDPGIKEELIVEFYSR
jgi:small subunit ribosomal protein S4